MSNDIIDFEAPRSGSGASEQSDVPAELSKIASLNARAVLPDGRTIGRSDILQSLGLNPNTSPTAWLAVIACGSNASALLPGDLQRVAANRVSNAAAILSNVQGLAGLGGVAGGFVSGGRAPT